MHGNETELRVGESGWMAMGAVMSKPARRRGPKRGCHSSALLSPHLALLFARASSARTATAKRARNAAGCTRVWGLWHVRAL